MPDRLQESPLIALQQVRKAQDPGAELRNCLLRAVRNLQASASRSDRQAGTVLTHYYLKRRGNTELVAKKLGLPRTTFYRRLNSGHAHVSALLGMEELAALRVGRTQAAVAADAAGDVAPELVPDLAP